MNTIECIKLEDAIEIGSMSQSEFAPSTGAVSPLHQKHDGNLPGHFSQIHGVVVGEQFALSCEETVPHVTYPQLKLSRIGQL